MNNDEAPRGLTNADYLGCGIVIGLLIAGALLRWVG